MRLLGVIFLVILVSGCNWQYRKAIEACHDRVHSRAKHQAEIVTTETLKSMSSDVIVTGRAKLQNGFGAWTNYRYRCSVYSGDRIGKFEMNEGY
ncbi:MULTISPECIES: hypothetical protein [Idiomarina]|uniref:hypothetical protein n=1 Tax=Idiomarina TaxID=135575 RepID=UPI00129B8DDD|nr:MULTISPECIES: hypothetical protein [Idiomarina]MRJ40799.1 hypothetical protein [Idiomarina sp. FeN1]NCU56603.1 hypothetical protein [Idiomarina sp. FenA--70]NCU58983.1 hypothetical protein [Idiomarina sp. FenBw--71]UUN14520.1 hypothetical protein KGF88_04715 [Idiomarina loihiensis]